MHAECTNDVQEPFSVTRIQADGETRPAMATSENKSRGGPKSPHTGMTVLLHARKAQIHLHNQVEKVLKKTTTRAKDQEQLSLQKKIKIKAILETGEAL